MSFPTSIKTFTAKTDNVDEIKAVDINDVQTEITAIETELGTNPKGTAASVKARIEAIEAQFAITAGKVLTLLKNLTSQGGDGTLVFPPSGATLTIPASTEIREKLIANRTYYVRTDGDDSHTGLVNSAAGAFKTIQYAINLIANTLDIAGKTVTVQIGDGTYEENVALRNVVGYASPGNLVIQGNSTTPTNVVISPSSGTAIYSSDLSTVWDIKYLKVSGGIGLYAAYGSTIRYMSVDFGACTNYQIVCSTGFIRCIGNYTISGNSSRHLWLSNGTFECINRTITITNNITFTTYVDARSISYCNHSGCTFNLGSYTVIGKRYNAASLSFINTNGGGADYFPGNSAGSVDPTSVYA